MYVTLVSYVTQSLVIAAVNQGLDLTGSRCGTPPKKSVVIAPWRGMREAKRGMLKGAGGEAGSGDNGADVFLSGWWFQ